MFNDATTMASGFTTGASPVTSTNVVDMGAADGDEGDGPEVVVLIEGGDSTGDTGTIQVVLQESATSGGSYVTILTGRVSAANYTDFSPYRMKVPPKHKQFLRLQYVIATNSATAGTLHAGIV
jgi:hypothetical protein